MAFLETNSGIQTIGIACYIVVSLLLLYYAYLLKKHGRPWKCAVHILLAVMIYGCVPILREYLKQNELLPVKLYTWQVALVILLAGVYSGVSLYREIKEVKSRLSDNSIKESFDTLPAGVCFFSETGLLVLCNRQMHKLAYELLGKDVQLLHEIKEGLDQPKELVKKDYIGNELVYRFSDGSVWQFQESQVKDIDGFLYTQITAADLTELFHLQWELDDRNEALHEMLKQLRRIEQNVADIIRNQEILTAKIRVHNKMGNSLLATRRFLIQDCPLEQKEQLITIWKDTLSALQNEVGQEDEPDTFEEVKRIGKSIGVDIFVEGEIPENQRLLHLFTTALRECLTNTIRHAEGTELHMRIQRLGNEVQAIYQNNGILPKEKITEGGGLGSLRKKIEEQNGTMEVLIQPQFTLKVTLKEDDV